MQHVMVLEANGRICAAGPITAGFAAPEGGSIVPAPDTIHDDLARMDGPGADLIWQGGKIVKKARPKAAAEVDADERATLAAQLDNALGNWAALAPAQKDALLLALARGVRKTIG